MVIGGRNNGISGGASPIDFIPILSILLDGDARPVVTAKTIKDDDRDAGTWPDEIQGT